MIRTLLAGCSFTDPLNQLHVPWSIHYSNYEPAYIVAKAGMGIYGICHEIRNYITQLQNINKIILMVPTIWRLDMEFDIESNPCTAMVDLLECKNGAYIIKQPAKRKWICCNDPSRLSSNIYKNYMETTYKIMGIGNVAQRSLMALEHLILYCHKNNIEIHITAIADPVEYLEGIDYMPYVSEWLTRVGYKDWFKFDGYFVDKFLKHDRHPTTEEHKILADYIIKGINK